MKVPGSPLVSVIIPAHDAERWIADAIGSALAQTWPNTEVIVVDDGSSDETAAVAERFVSARVRLVRQQRAGASAARNRGISEARGDYLQFLDADDLLGPTKIESQLDVLGGRPAGTVASGSWGRFSDDPGAATFTPSALWADLAPVDFLTTAWNGHLMMQPGVWLVPRDVIDRAGPWDERLSLNDDGEYFTRVVLASRGLAFCSDARVYYRSNNPASLASQANRRAVESQLLSLELSAENLLQSCDTPMTRRAAANLLQRFVYDTYPAHRDLLDRATRGIARIGAPDAAPDGPPGFHVLRRVLGWKLARRIQRAATRGGLNRAALRRAVSGA
jgi:glycosyltransferase involved in cell wall biosynthesis